MQKSAIKWSVKELGQTTVLNAGKRGLKSSDCITIATALRKHPEVTELKLQQNEIGDEGVEALAAVLRQSNVSTLWLGENPITARGAEAIAAGCEGSSVSWLVLKLQNKVGDEGAMAIARSLPKTRLENLVLIGLNIGDEGARYRPVQRTKHRVCNLPAPSKTDLISSTDTREKS